MLETRIKTASLGEFIVNQPVSSFPINERLTCYPKKLWIQEIENPTPIDLTPREVFALLVLVDNYDEFVPYEKLFYKEHPSNVAIRGLVHDLRRKINDPRCLIADRQGKIKLTNPDRDEKIIRPAA